MKPCIVETETLVVTEDNDSMTVRSSVWQEVQDIEDSYHDQGEPAIQIQSVTLTSLQLIRAH